jgi:hypothetical protein
MKALQRLLPILDCQSSTSTLYILKDAYLDHVRPYYNECCKVRCDQLLLEMFDFIEDEARKMGELSFTDEYRSGEKKRLLSNQFTLLVGLTGLVANGINFGEKTRAVTALYDACKNLKAYAISQNTERPEEADIGDYSFGDRGIKFLADLEMKDKSLVGTTHLNRVHNRMEEIEQLIRLYGRGHPIECSLKENEKLKRLYDPLTVTFPN